MRTASGGIIRCRNYTLSLIKITAVTRFPGNLKSPEPGSYNPYSLEMAFIARSTSFSYMRYDISVSEVVTSLISTPSSASSVNIRAATGHIPHAFAIYLQLGVVSVHFDPEVLYDGFESIQYTKCIHKFVRRKAEGQAYDAPVGGTG